MLKHHLSLIGLLAVATVAAQTREVWTYQDCVDYAREHNISLQQSQLAEQRTDYSVEAAKAQWEPTLDFGTSHAFSNSIWGEGKHNTLGGNFSLNAG